MGQWGCVTSHQISVAIDAIGDEIPQANIFFISFIVAMVDSHRWVQTCSWALIADVAA